MIYVLLGLLIFYFILILLLFVMYRYTKNLKIISAMRIKPPEDHIDKNKFYKREIYESVVRCNTESYDARGRYCTVRHMNEQSYAEKGFYKETKYRIQ